MDYDLLKLINEHNYGELKKTFEVIDDIEYKLVEATIMNNYALVKKILDNNPYLIHWNINGTSLLHIAIEYKSYSIIKLLLKKNINIHQLNNEGFNVINLIKHKYFINNFLKFDSFIYKKINESFTRK